MLLNLFFFTVTISKRKFSNEEISKAYQIEQVESHLDAVKTKHIDQQIMFL
ncbi:MAG: YrzI family small protein [Anaerobacillus sp.]|jgi:uncharacterized protein (TIGR02413 family)|uniref:YrzI family small protein n=1 Tax=Anaerobacillus sp. TaxID=1872506 RepID=UPI00391B809D